MKTTPTTTTPTPEHEKGDTCATRGCGGKVTYDWANHCNKCLNLGLEG